MDKRRVIFHVFICIVVLLSTITLPVQSSAFIWENLIRSIKPITKLKDALPNKKIIELAKIVTDEEKGLEKIGKILGKRQLSNEILEDTYMRIALYNGK